MSPALLVTVIHCPQVLDYVVTGPIGHCHPLSPGVGLRCHRPHWSLSSTVPRCWTTLSPAPLVTVIYCPQVLDYVVTGPIGHCHPLSPGVGLRCHRPHWSLSSTVPRCWTTLSPAPLVTVIHCPQVLDYVVTGPIGHCHPLFPGVGLRCHRPRHCHPPQVLDYVVTGPIGHPSQ